MTTTTIYIIFCWLALAGFNLVKINQSTYGAKDVFTPLFAIVFAPLYTLIAFIGIFIIKKWN